MAKNEARKSATEQPSFAAIKPAESIDLEYGLSLVSRLKLVVSFKRSEVSYKPIDEWQIKLSLTTYLRDSLSLSVSDSDVIVSKFKDLKKRKRDEAVAFGSIFVWEGSGNSYEEFLQWRDSIVKKLDGLQLNSQGLQLLMEAQVPEEDDFEKMQKNWTDFFASRSRGRYSRNDMQQPDTIIVEGVPSRWFSEPRVSSNVSLLVTHTIFSKFGRIRNLNVVGNNDLCDIAKAIKEDITLALQCKVWVQYESYGSFYNAMKAMCGRSMVKEGSRLKANYRVSWDKEGYFLSQNISFRESEKQRHRQVGNTQIVARSLERRPAHPYVPAFDK